MISQGNTLVQCFAPHEIWTGTTLDTTNVIAIRSVDVLDYQINGSGPVGKMLGVTAIQPNVASIVFSSVSTVEIMRG